MPECLHPYQILHPTVKKWKNERASLGLVTTQEDIERFCDIHCIESSMMIPCGKCLYCYQRKQEAWRVRLQQEQKANFVSYFVTLTYADEFVPKDGVLKSDFQRFMKRFRHNLAIPCRYFAVSEYGPKGTRRPHYHFALFLNQYVSFEDLLLTLKKSWHSIVNLQYLCDGRISYLSTYCIKFFNTAPHGKNDNFMLCSRRPFIGAGFMSSEMVNNQRQKLNPFITVNGYKKPMPRIYKEKIFDDDMLVQLRQKMQDFKTKILEEMIESYGSLSSYEEALREQAKRDYNRAWNRFRESKKL